MTAVGGPAGLAAASLPGSARARRRQRSGRSARNPLFVLAMLAPALVYFIVWIFGPTIYGFYLSLTDANFITPPSFVGLANYRALLHDDQFQAAMRITVVYAAESVVPTLLVSLFVARALAGLARGRGLYLTLLFVPFVVPGVAAALVFGLLFQQYGLVNSALHTSVAWLADARFAMVALSLVTIWGMVGYYTIIFTAGYQQIPRELVEASTLDGAGSLKRLWYIELPLLRPTLLFCGVTSLAAVMTNFGTPYVLTAGGPGTATQTLPLLVYDQAFQYSAAGAGESMSVVLLVFTLLLTLVQVRLLFSDRSPRRRRR